MCEYRLGRATKVYNPLFTLSMVGRLYLQHGPHCVDLSKVLGLVGDFLAWWRIYVMGNYSVVLLCILGRALACLFSRAIFKIVTIFGRGVSFEVESWTGNLKFSEILVFIFFLTQSSALRNL